MKRKASPSGPIEEVPGKPNREILLSLYKVHILARARSEPVYGGWVLEEMRRRGYAISPGTVYPLLGRLAAAGWLAPEENQRKNPRYLLTEEGARLLENLEGEIEELAEVLRRRFSPSDDGAELL